jgi:hypothetical protein
MRPLDAVFEDATALLTDASALMHRAPDLRRELEAATAAGADEASGSCTARSRPGSKPDSFRGSRPRCGNSGTRGRRAAVGRASVAPTAARRVELGRDSAPATHAGSSPTGAGDARAAIWEAAAPAHRSRACRAAPVRPLPTSGRRSRHWWSYQGGTMIRVRFASQATRSVTRVEYWPAHARVAVRRG